MPDSPRDGGKRGCRPDDGWSPGPSGPNDRRPLAQLGEDRRSRQNLSRDLPAEPDREEEQELPLQESAHMQALLGGSVSRGMGHGSIPVNGNSTQDPDS